MFEETLCSSSSLENNNACKSEEGDITCSEALAYVKEKEVTSPLKHLLSLQWETTPKSKYKKHIKRVRFAIDSAENSSTETSEEVHEKIMTDSFVEVKDACASKNSSCVNDVQDSVDDYYSTKSTMELSSVDSSKNEDPCCYVALKCEKLNINCSNDNFSTGKSANSVEEINGNVIESCGYFHNQSNILRGQKINNEVILVSNKDESDFLTLDAVDQVNNKEDDKQCTAVSESGAEDTVVREDCHNKVSNEKISKNALQKRSGKTFSGGKQSFRLNSLINKEDAKLCSATEIKSAIFKAWCKLKKDASNAKYLGNGLNASDKDAVLNKYKPQQLNNFCNFSDAAVKDVKISKKENLTLNTKHDMVSFPTSSNIHKQSCKVNSLLRDDNINVYNAFDLKSTMFDAWCKVKKHEFRTKSTVESVVNKEKEMVKRSVSCGARKLTKVQKKKKKHEAVLNSVTDQNTSKADDDESKMAFRSWRKKKDEILKEQAIKKKEDEMKKQMDALVTEEIRKQDAHSAYASWQTHKTHVINMEKRMKEWLIQKEKEKVDLKLKRDEEALKSYYMWLRNKYSSRTSLYRAVKKKPPWFPPGKS